MSSIRKDTYQKRLYRRKYIAEQQVKITVARGFTPEGDDRRSSLVLQSKCMRRQGRVIRVRF